MVGAQDIDIVEPLEAQTRDSGRGTRAEIKKD